MSGNDSYTKLLMHGDGSDVSTTIPDSSIGGDHGNATVVGNAQLDTAQKKYGTASLLVDADADYIYWPDHDDWYQGTGNFTIDFCKRFSDLSTHRGLFQQYVDADNYVSLYWADNVNKFTFRLKNASPYYYFSLESSVQSISVDTWYHLAVIRGWGEGSNDWAITLDGTAIATGTDADAWPQLAAPFCIGRGYYASATVYDRGWTDEFRISKGIARWTSNFTPPVGGYSKLDLNINISDVWKGIDEMKINIGDTWKEVSEMKSNIGDVWKTIF